VFLTERMYLQIVALTFGEIQQALSFLS
jgi:hypothetical protein